MPALRWIEGGESKPAIGEAAAGSLARSLGRAQEETAAADLDHGSSSAFAAHARSSRNLGRNLAQLVDCCLSFQQTLADPRGRHAADRARSLARVAPARWSPFLPRYIFLGSAKRERARQERGGTDVVLSSRSVADENLSFLMHEDHGKCVLDSGILQSTIE